MDLRMLGFLAANLPLVSFLLLVACIGLSVVFHVRERAKIRLSIEQEVQAHVRTELGMLVGDVLRRSEEARQQLSVLAAQQAEVQERKAAFQAELEASKGEIDKLLAEIRRVGAEVARIAPTASDLGWASPATLLSHAVQSPDWPTAAGCLARIDRENATSSDLEGAGDICRNRGVHMRALQFYQEAADKDPENLSARGKLLALGAEMRAADRAECLQKLQELVAQNLTNPLYGAAIEASYFLSMMTLGRHREWAEFCEIQLKRPLPRSAQSCLLRHLALCWQKLGRQEEALATCDAALKLFADDAELLSLYSRLLLNARKYEEAYRAGVRVLQRNPSSARHYIVLAEVQEKRIGRSAARDILRRALQWANGKEQFEIEEYQGKLAALDELSQIVPATHAQIIQA